MIRKPFQDLSLPNLGLGCMRLPLGEDGKPDCTAVCRMVDYALLHGVNYFDTGYGYHDGLSEQVLGKALAKHERSSYYIADKFPGYDPMKWKKIKTVFPEQLERLGTDYIDFYLFHNVCELNIDAYLDPKYGIFDYIMEQKAAGHIRHVGFSVHGTTDTMRRFLDAYGHAMEFCQIQLNYLDYEFQKANEKLQLLATYNLPVFVMEPLRGGRLVRLPEQYAAMFRQRFPENTTLEMAFRFVRSFSAVTLTLSGMSDMEQLKENIALFEQEHVLSDDTKQALIDFAANMTQDNTVPCTACRYCTEKCPRALDIPTLIDLYNEHHYSGGGFIAPFRVSSMDRNKRPNMCIGCHACEAVCPQNIKIADCLSELSQKLGLPAIKK